MTMPARVLASASVPTVASAWTPTVVVFVRPRLTSAVRDASAVTVVLPARDASTATPPPIGVGAGAPPPVADGSATAFGASGCAGPEMFCVTGLPPHRADVRGAPTIPQPLGADESAAPVYRPVGKSRFTGTSRCPTGPELTNGSAARGRHS